jgi:1,4-dihydroxy-2-naphthoate octaprenyltransferase
MPDRDVKTTPPTTTFEGGSRFAPTKDMKSKLLILFLASRPKFLVASTAPVLVGSALAFATAGTFSLHLFILALLAIMALHSGANVANDYFDHISRNDWVNQNPTPFSGGRRYIQQGILSPKATLLLSLLAFTIGAILGIIIFLLTHSIFILALGLIGLLGGFFYTAPPIRLGYRSVGEPIIALLFGLLPVYGSYYLQTETLCFIPLLPAVIVGILIFLVILINEFPDAAADAAVNKRTLVVRFGIPISIWIYRIMLSASYLVAVAAMLIYRPFVFAGLLYLLTLPIAIVAIKAANKNDLLTPGRYRVNELTVFLHALGCLTLAAGFIIFGLSWLCRI